MSRSFKQPYYTDNGPHTKIAKRLASKKIRQKKPFHMFKSIDSDELDLDWIFDLANNGCYKKNFERWDIRDFSFFSPKDPKAYRK